MHGARLVPLIASEIVGVQPFIELVFPAFPNFLIELLQDGLLLLG